MAKSLLSRFVSITVVLSALSAISAAFADTPKRVPGPDQIQVEILSLKSNQGTVYCTIYPTPGDGFPVDAKKALKSSRSKIAHNKARCDFDGVAPGVYAVGMIHDENDNHKLDTNWIGIPTEGYGTSRDAVGKFGPPSFKDAAFSYGGGAVRIAIHPHY